VRTPYSGQSNLEQTIKCSRFKPLELGAQLAFRGGYYPRGTPALVMDGDLFMLLAAMAVAFARTVLGNVLAQKTTIRTIQIIASIMVLGIAVGLSLGIV
jgi:hypothetical protein